METQSEEEIHNVSITMDLAGLRLESIESISFRQYNDDHPGVAEVGLIGTETRKQSVAAEARVS